MTPRPRPRCAVGLEDGYARFETLGARRLCQDAERGIAIPFGGRRPDVGELLRQLKGGAQVAPETVAGGLYQRLPLPAHAIPVMVDAIEAALGERNDDGEQEQRDDQRATGPVASR